MSLTCKECLHVSFTSMGTLAHDAPLEAVPFLDLVCLPVLVKQLISISNDCVNEQRPSC